MDERFVPGSSEFTEGLAARVKPGLVHDGGRTGSILNARFHRAEYPDRSASTGEVA